MMAVGSKVAVLGFAAAALALAGAAGAQTGEARQASGERVGEAVERAIEAEGPWLTKEEQALIERKCGQAPGSSERHGISLSDGALRCPDGRKVDDAETRALVAVVQPRIERRVKAVMESAAVKQAIALASAEAAVGALRSVDHAKIAREAARDVEAALREAEAALREARREKR